MARIAIDKLEIARRQLDAAIEMFFNDGDPIAVHGLAAASYDVLTDLLAHTGEADEFMRMLRPEFRDQVRSVWRTPQNFFKHADRDPNAVLDYETGLAEQFLFFACRRYRRFGSLTMRMQILQVYYLLRHPEVLSDPATQRQAQTAPAWMTRGPKREFYAVMLSVAREQAAHT